MLLIKCRRIDQEQRLKVRNHKLEEIEKLKEELEDFNRKKEIAIESGDDFLEVFDKEIPETPEEEFD